MWRLIFVWTYFCRWSNFSNFAWINFRCWRNLYLKKLFFLNCLKETEKTKGSRHENIFFHSVSTTNTRLVILQSLRSCLRFIITTFIIWTFKSVIEPESNVNLLPEMHPKKRKVTEKKTRLPKGMNVKSNISQRF